MISLNGFAITSSKQDATNIFTQVISANENFYEKMRNANKAKGSKNVSKFMKKICDKYANNCKIFPFFREIFFYKRNAKSCAGNHICGLETKLKWVSFLPSIKTTRRVHQENISGRGQCLLTGSKRICLFRKGRVCLRL